MALLHRQLPISSRSQFREFLRHATRIIESEHVGLAPRVGILAAIEICERPPVGVLDTEATGNFQYGPRCGEAGSQHAVDLA